MLVNFNEALSTAKETEFKITQTAKGGETIHQTQRNNLGNLLKKALFADLAELYPISKDNGAVVVYLTSDGIILEIPNASVNDQITNPDGSGAISVQLSVSVKGLEYNAEDLSEAYKITLAENEAKAKKKAEIKAKNIAADQKAREAKKKKTTN